MFSFRLKTIVGIAAIEAVFLLVIGWSALDFLKDSNQRLITEHVRATADLFASMSKDALLSTDLASLESVIDEILKNPDIRYARVVSAAEGVLAQKGEAGILHRPFRIDSRFEAIDDDIFDARAEISEGGIPFGHVEVGFSVDSIRPVLREARDYIIVLASVEMALTAIFSVLLGYALTRQLDSLMAATKHIGRGDFSHRVAVRGRDELAQTAVMFNRMTEELGATYERLKGALSAAKRSSRELKESEARLKAIFEGAVDGIIIIDSQGLVLDINPAARHIFGYPDDAVLGQNVSMLMPEPHRSRHDTYIRNYFETGTARVIGSGREVEGLRRDGQTFPMDLSLSEIALGERTFFTGIVRDITRRKQAEEELRRYQAGLEDIVDLRTRELESAQAQLVAQAMDSARVQWAATVLHNIGNAVTPLKVQLELFGETDTKKLIDYLGRCYRDLAEHAGELQHYIETDARGGEVFRYLGELVSDLAEQGRRQRQALSKMDAALTYISQILSLQQAYAAAGKDVREALNINRLLEDALTMLGSLLDKRGIRVERRLDADLPGLIIDRSQMMQVILNFLKNGYESIEMAGPDSERQLTVASFGTERAVGFTVTDTGVGMTPQALSSLFRFGASRKGSSGIGLYYCKRFVEANQGRLTITSPGPGRGASVRVEFERTGQQVDAATAQSPRTQ